MSGEQSHVHTPYHPRWDRRGVPLFWWSSQLSYTLYMIREFTSVFVGWFAFLGLFFMRALYQGPEAYEAFLARMHSPGFYFLNGIAFLFVLFHAFTWFHAAPKANVFRLGERRVPDAVIVIGHYLAWIVLSAAVALIWVG